MRGKMSQHSCDGCAVFQVGEKDFPLRGVEGEGSSNAYLDVNDFLHVLDHPGDDRSQPTPQGQNCGLVDLRGQSAEIWVGDVEDSAAVQGDRSYLDQQRARSVGPVIGSFQEPCGDERGQVAVSSRTLHSKFGFQFSWSQRSSGRREEAEDLAATADNLDVARGGAIAHDGGRYLGHDGFEAAGSLG